MTAPTEHRPVFSDPETREAEAALARRTGVRRPGLLVVLICVLGLLVTALASLAALRADRNTEQRLLGTQTWQAAAVLSTAIVAIDQSMASALDVEAALPPAERRTAFSSRFGRNVGPAKLFVSASLWSRQAGALTRVASIGAAPGVRESAPELRTHLRRALASTTSVVGQVTVGRQLRITYARGDRTTGLVIYAERAIPADRRAPVDRNSAYADLDYAIYLGRSTDTGHMTTTDVDPDSLPLTGVTARATVPFGDTVLTIVTSPRDHLGSRLSKWLPLALLLGGLLLTGVATLVVRKLLVARDRAEKDTATITTLYERVDTLYGEQRDLSLRLQHSLLPHLNPDIPGVEVASRYVAGTTGLDIGGDWFSVIRSGEDGFAFVVGDVSGHGIDAVAEMARARFTLRAYLIEGHSPHEALARSSRQFDVATDGHIVTALVGVGNRRTGEIAVANAGHPLPVLATGGRAELVAMPVGPPLGVGPTTYQPASFTMPVDSTLICYTDGLVERRDEDIDSGTRRLVDEVRGLVDQPLPGLIGHLLDTVRDAAAADDVAVLAMRKTDA